MTNTYNFLSKTYNNLQKMLDMVFEGCEYERAFACERSAMSKNNVRKLREELLMSKAELARKAGVSALTIDRIEGGKSCRMDTKRKIILALGFKLADKEKVFDKTENLAKRADQEGGEEGGEAAAADDEEATTEEA